MFIINYGKCILDVARLNTLWQTQFAVAVKCGELRHCLAKSGMKFEIAHKATRLRAQNAALHVTNHRHRTDDTISACTEWPEVYKQNKHKL